MCHAAFWRHLRSLLFVPIICGGCDPLTDRPDFGPLTAAVVDTVFTRPPAAIAALSAVIDSAGLTVRRQSSRDGYLETESFDVRSRAERGQDVYNPERVVILRFWADLLPGARTRITAEAAHRTTSDPSLDARLAETMAARDHEGYELLIEILRSTKSRVGG